MKIRDLMTREIVTITKGCLITEAAELMKDKDISCLVVTRGDVVEGIITERDVLRKIVANQKIFHQIQVNEIMSDAVITIEDKSNIHDAIILMEDNHIRRLVAVRNDKMSGLITQTDLVRVLKKQLV